MASPETEIRYDKSAALYPRAEFPTAETGKSFAGAPTELLLVQGGNGGETLPGAEAEAEMVAEKLRNMMDEGFLVHDKDKGGYRPLRWRDVAIRAR